jgi:hypothetical protein
VNGVVQVVACGWLHIERDTMEFRWIGGSRMAYGHMIADRCSTESKTSLVLRPVALHNSIVPSQPVFTFIFDHTSRQVADPAS